MTVNGEGKAPGRQDLLALAREVSIPLSDAERIIEEVCEGVSAWKKLAASLDIAQERIAYIAQNIETNLRRLRA